MNEGIPIEDDLDRLRAELGVDCDLTAAELDEVVSSLAWAETSMVKPPEDLKNRVLDALPGVGGTHHSQWIAAADDFVPQPSSKLFLATALPWAAAVVFGLGMIYFWMEKSDWKETASAAELRLKESNRKNEVLLTEIEAFQKGRELDQLKIVSLQSELDTAYFGAAVWDAQSETGMLQVSRIPTLEAKKDYQLWIVDPQYKTPVDGGVFQVDAKGAATIKFKPSLKIDQVAAFAVSLEKKGGVPVAEGPMVLVGSL